MSIKHNPAFIQEIKTPSTWPRLGAPIATEILQRRIGKVVECQVSVSCNFSNYRVARPTSPQQSVVSKRLRRPHQEKLPCQSTRSVSDKVLVSTQFINPLHQPSAIPNPPTKFSPSFVSRAALHDTRVRQNLSAFTTPAAASAPASQESDVLSHGYPATIHDHHQQQDRLLFMITIGLDHF